MRSLSPMDPCLRHLAEPALCTLLAELLRWAQGELHTLNPSTTDSLSCQLHFQ